MKRIFVGLLVVLTATVVLTVQAQGFSATIGDYVFIDVNTDGVQDAGDVPYPGVTVNLFNDVDGDGVAEPGADDGAAIATATTDNAGAYTFNVTGAASTAYFVQFALPAEATANFTTANVDDGNPNPDERDSDADPATGLTAVFTVADAATDTTVDAGVDCSSGAALDITFVIDTTGSMFDEITAIQTSIGDILTTVRAVVADSQFGLTSYRDVGDLYTARVDSPLTADTVAFTAAVNTLAAGGGGDFPEAVFAGLNEGINLAYRPGTGRAIVLIGDARPKDPDPLTGQTLTDIVNAANGKGIRIFSVVASGGNVADFAPISNGTGGTVIPNINAGQIANEILSALSVVICNPTPAVVPPPPPPAPPPPVDDDDDDDPVAEIDRGCIALNGQTEIFEASVQEATVVVDGTIGEVYCRVINANGSYVTDISEVGIQEVVERGVLQAVDIFGLLPGGEYVVPFQKTVSLCLRGSGEYLFISATTQPRTVQSLGAVSSGGYTCANIPNAGTAVLVPGGAAPAPVAAPAVDAPADAGGSTTLTGCSVTTTNAVRGRSAPDMSSDDNVMTTVPFDLTLTATERVPGWYRVIYLDMQVWISADFLDTRGSC